MSLARTSWINGITCALLWPTQGDARALRWTVHSSSGDLSERQFWLLAVLSVHRPLIYLLRLRFLDV